MTYNGKVHNGVVVLDNGAQLPEGTQVRVEPLHPVDAEDVPTLYEQLQPLVGSVEGLPPDMAANHDHYLHGQPKR
jgi:hypothetical protein